MSTKRTALIFTTVGLTAGLGLGVTGLASAAGSAPTPDPSAKAGHRLGGHGPRNHDGLGPFGQGGKGFRLPTGGLVTAVAADSLTVDTLGGTSQKITLNAATTYLQGKDKKTSSILKVGEVVAVLLVDDKSATPVAKSVIVLPSHLAGWVTAISGSTITITDDSGFSRVVKTTAATTYEKDGDDATASAVTVGSFITALGGVDADGTSLDATRVSLGRGGPDLFGGGFGPGKGGHHDFRGGPRPQGTPKPKTS